MIYKATSRSKKGIALFFLTLFYCNFVLGAYIPIRDIVYNNGNVSHSFHFNGTQSVLNGTAAFSQKDKLLEISNARQIDSRNFEHLASAENIGGPTQPEMSAFQSVNSNNMVDLFTGDFSYNIPLLDVGGYPVNLFYRSGITMDQEASWVGLGWNINPGTITRNLRGIPDDFEGNNDAITKITSIKDDVTTGAFVAGDLEVFGLMGVTAGLGVFNNSYRGWGIENSINTSLSAGFASMGRFTASLSINNNSQEGVTISPSMDVSLAMKEADFIPLNFSSGFSLNSRSGLKANLSTGVSLSLQNIKNQLPGNRTLYGSSITFVSPSYTPTVSLPYTNKQTTFTIKVGGQAFPLHLSGFARGYQTSQSIKDEDTSRTVRAYGYLNYQNAVGHDDALLDFNREKELVYREKPEYPNLAIPAYTYDLFSISGEGTGGMFRAYRSDIGYVYDASVSTKSDADQFGFDFGLDPNVAHAGVNVEFTDANTTGGPWLENNAMSSSVQFRQSDSNFQSVYFKNPAEKAINTKEFYKTVGDDDVVTAGLYQAGSTLSTTNFLQHYRNKSSTGNSILTLSNSYKSQRDKRAQVITYLNAGEASNAALDKSINIYSLNKWGTSTCNDSSIIKAEERTGGIRKLNHISEIDVLNADGKRYVYGIPVYNKFQDEVTYAINSGDRQTGLAPYNSNDDNSHKNDNGKDNYYNKEHIPGYAHSFLLTGILSPDYVDVKGDGITDDDLGDAIKINYSRVADSVNAFGWRTPYSNSVTYNEGLQTYNRDDRGSYIYGEKELWYLNSIESKSMVAQFIVESRADLRPINRNGQISPSTPSKRLKEIRLYSKADLIKNGEAATPIKTVHFEYDYTLCQNPNYSNQGKLTLKKIWFSYNGNEKGMKNPYVFNYNNVNPTYDNRSFDRWGSYKNATDNPHGNLTNAEFPYGLQDSIKAKQNAAAWTLDSIVLPSGGRIKVNYESDDYAYVQNKRAMQMFNVIGLSRALPITSHASGSPNDLQDSLYTYQRNITQSQDHLFVGIKTLKPVANNSDVAEYLKGINTLYFKLKVVMPTDEWGSGAEYVPCYADIDISQPSNYGYMAGDPSIIWVKIKGVSLTGEDDGDFSPLAKAAIQFLRLNLPSKAYPGSETTDNLDPVDAIQMIASTGIGVIKSFSSFDRQARENAWAVKIDPDRSWVRLNNPNYKKLGGGLRVKAIKIYDNWKNMTDNQQRESVYGQEYEYTTTKTINGEQKIISSGVASYEPMIGNEENPWRLPVEFIDKASLMAPVTLGYSETPFGESFFPAATVGYSRVIVKSINIRGVKSANGFEETKFYTTYDFPTLIDNSMLNGDNKKRYNISVENFLKVNTKHYLAMSQGFKIELNDMNGKTRSQASYSQTDSLNPISYTENFYRIDDKNAEFKHLNNTVSSVNAQGTIDNEAIIGKDVELMMDMRQQKSSTIANNYNLDLDIFTAGLFPFFIPNKLPLPQKEQTMFRSAATTKIIQRYGLLDSIVVIDKGSRISTENLLYDSETGEVVLTRTRNEFNDTIYNFNYPAHWAYSGMGMAYQNIDAVFGTGFGSKLAIVNGKLQNTNRYGNVKGYLESGDEILVYGRKKTGEDTTIDCTGHSTCISNIYASANSYTTVWAIDSKKIDPASNEGIIFMERDGKPYSGLDISMRIIRSGHRNLTSTSLGTITSLKTPIKKIGSQTKLVIDNGIKVINTNAARFAEKWNVKDAYYLKDTSTSEIFSDTLYPSSLAIKEYNWKDGDGAEEHFYANASYVGASYDTTGTDDGDGLGSCNRKVIKNKTIVQYNFSSIPTDVDVLNASIKFVPKTPNSGFCNIRYTATDHDCETKDWTTATTYYSGNSIASLKRITSPWNSTTPYSSFLTTDINKLVVDQTSYPNLACTDLIQDVLDNNVSRTYGLAFSMNDESANSNAHTLKYLTFSGNGTTPELFIQYSIPHNFTVCRSAITQRDVNPYVYGILGNWRLEKAYVFNDDRAESNFSLPVNIRTNGVLKNFNPYWSFSTSYLTSTSDTTQWVWNTQTTFYNRKGFEIENKDPLGRYNTGSYGYNETLPTSVTQNSRYQQQFFDGFEDYGYTTANCSECPVPREVDFVNGDGSLVTTNKHTGRYSLRINGLGSAGQTFSVGASASDPLKLELEQDSYGMDTIVSPLGNGLSVDLNNDPQPKPIRYKGYIQANTSGFYTITSKMHHSKVINAPDEGYFLSVGSTTKAFHDITQDISIDVFLKAGEKTTITVATHSGNYFTSDFLLTWKRIGSCVTSEIQVPTANLYSSNVADNSVSYSSGSCSRLTGIKTDSSSLLPTFKPMQGNKLLFSVWVKEEKNCLCQQYEENSVKFLFKRSSNPDSTASIKPTGNIIEGWQRYEAVIPVPADAVSMNIALKADSDSPVYFDDIRMLPFNANMKSFVYDPVSLRLMAELDENNYASFYEYDNDGTLTRVKKETERGIQTIKETRSNLSEK